MADTIDLASQIAKLGQILNVVTLVDSSGNKIDGANPLSTSPFAANQDNITLLASAAITANGNSADQTNDIGRGLLLFITTGSFGSGASGITVTIEGKDPVSGSYYTILTSAALSASGFTVLRVYPGLTAAANTIASDVLPKTWRVTYQATAWGTGGSTLAIAAATVA